MNCPTYNKNRNWSEARNNPLIRTLPALFGILVLVSTVRGEDWPQFRGPTGQGIAVGRLPTEWGPAKNIAWKQPIPGRGWSSPIIYQGRIYLTTAVDEGNKGLSLRALCLDAKEGKILWNKEVFHPAGKPPRMHSKNSQASPTPLTDGERLYVHFGHLGTAALDLKGEVLWRHTDLKYNPVHGNGGTPALVGNALIFSCDGASNPFVAALDRSDGHLLWKTPRKIDTGKKFSFSSPLAIDVKGQTQVIIPGAGAVCAYDPKDGKELWRVRYADGYSVVPRPVFGHGLLYLSSGFDSPSLLAIRPDGRGDVTDTHIAWTLRKAAPLTPSPLLVGKELYTVSDNGIASCLDAKTGKPHWQERIGTKFSASPMLADGKVYFLSEDGVGVVVKASPKFEVLSKNPMKESALASFAAADGCALLTHGKEFVPHRGEVNSACGFAFHARLQATRSHMPQLPIYLDNNATTRTDPRVVEAMLPYFTEHYGNAASRTHAFGWAAEEAVELAREQVAALIGAGPKEIVFTSGATESNNLALKGVAAMSRDKGDHIITAATEHKAVLDPCKRLERDGFEVTFLPVDRFGQVTPEQVAEAMTEQTILVSVMAANNEIGTLQPIREIGRLCKERGVLFHTDAVQAAGKVPSMWKRWVSTCSACRRTRCMGRRASVPCTSAAAIRTFGSSRSSTAAATSGACAAARCRCR